jgi:hypothetical protein
MPRTRSSRAQGRDADRPIEGAVGPTPQTVAKLRRDIVERLRQEGRLSEEQARAAAEVRRVWEAFGRGLFPRARELDQPRKPHGGMFVDPVERLTDGEERIWRLRYRPWAREMSVEIVANVVRVSRLQLVLDVVVDNFGVRQVEGWYRLRHGHALEHVRSALERYCEIAGWTARTGEAPVDSITRGGTGADDA